MLIDYVRQNTVGENTEVEGPYGRRKVTYADWTASGRALKFIEDYVDQEVLPLYGNSHTQTNKTGRQTSLFLEEARLLIKDKTGCTKHDALVFVGSGCTAAANRLVQLLGLQASWQIKKALQHSHPEMCRAVVFVSAYEHHSNLLPWRESLAEVVCIPDNPESGMLDLVILEEKLIQYADRPLRIGAFSAASNVTGIITDVDTVSILLHKHGALAVWDYACSAPYEEINMNARADGAHTLWSGAHKDAVFISPHKFLGGPQTPGILIFKKELSGRRDKCSQPGGGAVFYVSPEETVYLRHAEEREEAGTPALVGAIRCGLVFQLKHRIGCDTIRKRDDVFCQRVLDWMTKHPNIHVLGSVSCRRLPIISFMIHKDGMYLHYNYVCALLNDLFGIQVRGGCMCAGPYSQQLLGIDSSLSAKIQSELERKVDNEVLRPGYVRLSLHYTMDDSTVDFILQALDFVATDGWRLLPLHMFCPRSGMWMHRHNKRPKRSWLHDIDYDALMRASESKATASVKVSDQEGNTSHNSERLHFEAQELHQTFASYLLEARSQAEVASSQYKYGSDTVAAHHALPDSCEELRWFLMPSEAIQLLQRRNLNRDVPVTWRAPFACRDYEAASRGSPSIGWSSVHVSPASSPSLLRAALQDHTTHKKALQESAGGEQQQCSELDAEFAYFAHQLNDDEDTQSTSRSKAKEVSIPGVVPGSDVAKLFQKIYDNVVNTVKEHGMLQEGDRILVGLSGGKDSLTMLHVLRRMQMRSNPVKFELAAATVDPMAEGFDPTPLIPYLEQLGVPYFYERQDIISQAKWGNVTFSSEVAAPNPHTQPQSNDDDSKCGKPAEERSLHSICAFCSRMKRGVLYGCARKNGFNVLALGQHLDDLAESFVMSVFHNGFLRTMKANYTVSEGDLRVVRPLIGCREQECDDFADDAKLPVINENCPACFDAPRERYRTKCLLASQEQLYPHLFQSLQRSMRPLMEKDVEHYLQTRSTELTLKQTQRRKTQKLLKRQQKLGTQSTSDQSSVPSGAHALASVTEIHSMAEYDRLVASTQERDTLLVVKFGTSWCAPCKKLDPILLRMSKLNPSVEFATVDLECDEALADIADVDKLPTVKLYRAAAVIDVLVSPNEEALKRALAKAQC
eukprot:TRINITY_DN33112_c0_g1_i1.p1 TRINITY_DN33112_c0_g1~~TRINITY_DN33112_c0_g1_i1.p1  ORF type:complete len:1138 (-),score=174.55 TRINITY_DN33112_c0_g1_i1:199-3612(-)